MTPYSCQVSNKRSFLAWPGIASSGSCVLTHSRTLSAKRLATNQTDPSNTHPAAPLRLSGNTVPACSMLVMACISRSTSGTALAVANLALLPFCKARLVDAWSAFLTMVATRLSLSWPHRYASSTPSAFGSLARNDKAEAGATREIKVCASLVCAL
ncbi:hypothetical protein PO78_4277 [Thauera sp. SWB20]|nr:hypothetical protein PO78_4277 [Thauera sp. SWB20]